MLIIETITKKKKIIKSKKAKKTTRYSSFFRRAYFYLELFKSLSRKKEATKARVMS